MKELVRWAKSEGIARFHYGPIDIEFAPLAFVELAEKAMQDKLDPAPAVDSNGEFKDEFDNF